MFPNFGTRWNLLQRTADWMNGKDVAYVILAGALVDGRHIEKERKKLSQKINAAEKKIEALEALLDSTKAKSDNKKDAAVDRMAAEREISALNEKTAAYTGFLDELNVENMAKVLAKKIPAFRNRNGTVNLHVFLSPCHDKAVGEQVAEELKRLRDDIIVYPGSGRVQAEQAHQKTIEVLVPNRRPWYSAYDSTPVDRILNAHLAQSVKAPPDLYLIGSMGVNIDFPQHQGGSVPYVTVPSLFNFQYGDDDRYGHEIGAVVLTMTGDSPEPQVNLRSLNDFVADELRNIRLPSSLTKRQSRLIAELQGNKNAELTTGLLAKRTGLTENEVRKSLEPLVNRNYRRPKNWPGLRYDDGSRLWSLDKFGLSDLKYPPLFKDNSLTTDRLVAFGCPHFGSTRTTYEYALRGIPKSIIDSGATTMVIAGDVAEGNKHNLVEKREVYAGMWISEQEELAGRIIGRICLDVFSHRWSKTNVSGQRRLSPKDRDSVLKAVDEALISVEMIHGNHDDWQMEQGHEPLVITLACAKKFIAQRIFRMLEADGRHSFLATSIMDLIERKFHVPEDDGLFTLASGLKVGIIHPHMGGAKTKTIRIQSAMDMYQNCPLVIVANFHSAVSCGRWRPVLGQQFGLQLGTLKTGSAFEHFLMKSVHHGWAVVSLKSRKGRLIDVNSNFEHAPANHQPELDPKKPFKDLLKKLGINDDDLK
ncbi:hypothetical protein JW899_05455 [Candidatus Uhrbacteria bacterium]|nr:hypothetical protein [Candidatus Uhrbacteria bacterium]